MKPIQGLIWFTGWSAWTVASLQFYLLPFTLSNIAKFLDVEQSKISEVNTYTLLSRSVGAIIFGVLSDQYGRKIPLLIDLVCLGVLSLSSGFIHTYSQLIGVRLLFGKSLPPRCRGLRLIDNVGIAYGGVYGLVMASVLESVPRRQEVSSVASPSKVSPPDTCLRPVFILRCVRTTTQIYPTQGLN